MFECNTLKEQQTNSINMIYRLLIQFKIVRRLLKGKYYHVKDGKWMTPERFFQLGLQHKFTFFKVEEY